MLALITGASSGIGKEIAKNLANRGCDLIVVARNGAKLNELKNKLNVNVEVIELDLSKPDNSKHLYETVKDKQIDILINNAGYGKFGEVADTDLDEDLNMVMLNSINTHILTKLFLKDFLKRDRGYILNVSSSAGFMTGGPLMSTYYASKAYVNSFSAAVYQELKKRNSSVKISVLCPGPVKTDFNKRAGVKFAFNSLSPSQVASDALTGLFKGKFMIIPGTVMKTMKFLSRFASDKLILKITYHIQHRKNY